MAQLSGTTNANRRDVSRSQLFQQASAGTAPAATQSVFQGGIFAQGAGPDVNAMKLGFITLIDACSMIVGTETGFFATRGLPNVDVTKYASGPATRNYLSLGAAAEIPTNDSRGLETFFDGKVFDPTDPAACLKSLATKCTSA